MNASQLLKLLGSNRELIQRNNIHAVEDLQMLRKDFAHFTDEQVVLNMELNSSLAEIQFDSKYDNALENSIRVIAKFETSKFQNLLARHCWVAGRCLAKTGRFEEAEKYLILALEKSSEKEPDYISLKSDILLALTMNEQMAERGPEKSIEYLNEAITLLGGEGFDIRRANCLMGLGNVHINSGNPEEALKNYLAAEETFEKKFDLANMASVYSNIGTCYIEMMEYEKAKKYLQKSLELRIKVGSPDHLSISYYNLAMVYKGTNDLDRAHELLLKSREILLGTGSTLALAETDTLIAEIVALKSGNSGKA